jgi:hypothetical protein
MALNVMLSTSMNLSGRHIWAEEQRAFCSFNGFMNQMFVIQSQSYLHSFPIPHRASSLPIGLLTVRYSRLLDPHHRRLHIPHPHGPHSDGFLDTGVPDRTVVSTLDPLDTLGNAWSCSCGIWEYRRLYVSFPDHHLSLNSLACSILHTDILLGCWFTSDRIRLLVNFTPRWAIIVIILALYTRLCIFLYRSHKSISSDYETSASALPTELQQWQILDGQAGIPGGCEAHSVYPSVTPLKNVCRLFSVMNYWSWRGVVR